MIEIYYAPPSIYGRKTLAVLEEKGLDYEIKKMSFATRDMDRADYLSLNPNGEIPTLIDDGFVIYESTAIIEYLNDEYPEPPLMPEESTARASVRMIEDFCDLHLFPELVRCLIKLKVNKEELPPEDKQSVAKLMKRLDVYLNKKAFIAGEFSLADCAVMAAVASAEGFGIWDEVVGSGDLKSYANRLKKRPGYKGASLFSFETAATNA